MGPLDGLWHLLNFFAPAWGVSAIALAMAALVWRRPLKGADWLKLWMRTSGVGSAVLVLGLIALERDGRMATYAALVVGTAISLWWWGLRGKA